MVKIWHNPRCSKSRQTLDLLRDRGIDPEVVLYLDDTPEPEEIRRVAGLLGIPVRDMMRKKEDAYRTKDLDGVSDDDALIDAMYYHPILIERPIVINGDKAAIGRPPEKVFKVL